MSSVSITNISSTKNFAISDFNSRFSTLATAVNDNNTTIGNLTNHVTDTCATKETVEAIEGRVTALEQIDTGDGTVDLSGYVTDGELTTALSGYATADHTHDEYAAVSHTHDYAASDHTHSEYLTESTADAKYALKGDSSGGSGGSTTWSQSSKTGSTVSFTLVEDTEYTCSSELTSLTITASSFTGEAIVNFKSGSTATTFTCTSAKMVGLNCFGGTFTPTTTMCYTIMFDYDGTNVVGYVGGYTNA